MNAIVTGRRVLGRQSQRAANPVRVDGSCGIIDWRKCERIPQATPCATWAEGALVVGEAGPLKEGGGAAGVQQQGPGTAGRVEGRQVSVFLAFAGRHGWAFLGRAPLLPAA
jgi:hypothetical protein